MMLTILKITLLICILLSVLLMLTAKDRKTEAIFISVFGYFVFLILIVFGEYIAATVEFFAAAIFYPGVLYYVHKNSAL